MAPLLLHPVWRISLERNVFTFYINICLFRLFCFQHLDCLCLWCCRNTFCPTEGASAQQSQSTACLKDRAVATHSHAHTGIIHSHLFQMLFSTASPFTRLKDKNFNSNRPFVFQWESCWQEHSPHLTQRNGTFYVPILSVFQGEFDGDLQTAGPGIWQWENL